ncbi:MAG: T9SS type A sorting domain-containing protein, partial [Bacteroidetes bacterium]|nr:T9SS type A sorting domain-containing protein [Bacteroidota bacterium]
INNNDKIFYNLTGTWYNYGAQNGTLMIRPLFRYPHDIYVSNEKVDQPASDWLLYPNPAQQEVNISIPDLTGKITISILDISGRLLSQQATTGKLSTLAIDNLPSGIYFIRLTAENNRQYPVRKLIIR